MKFKYFSLFVSVLLFMVSCSADDNVSTTEISEDSTIVLDYNYSPLELETMTLINNYRVSKGLNSLEKINHVSYKSEEHDEYMIANNVVNHDYFEDRSSDIMKTLGAQMVSENIAYNYNSAQGAIDAWLKSEEHRETIEGNFTHFGLSVRENPVNGKKYYTNIFVRI